MKEQLALLRELQRIDLELDDLDAEKQELQARLSENAQVLDKLKAELDNQRDELGEIRDSQRLMRRELEEANEKLKERKKRLTNVGSTKEYNAVEKEIETLQHTIDQAEEQLLHLNEVIEQTEGAIGQKEEMVVRLRESIAQEEAKAESDLVALDKEIQRRKDRTEEARGEVSKRVLYKYDFIRKRRPGLAIAASKDGHCEACYMALPPQLFIQVQRGETLETCPSCQRILYFWEDALDEPALPSSGY